MKKRLAIIGSGIAGMGCAYRLKDRFDLTIFEKNTRIGGHTHTVTVMEGQTPVPIDTGFMVFNKQTYPNLLQLFSELDVAYQPTDMSFSVTHPAENLEWNGAGLNKLFSQRRNLLRPRFWHMVMEMNRFCKQAEAHLKDPTLKTQSLKTFVEENHYSEDFLDLFLAPMSAAVWSTPPEKMLSFPARSLIRFFYNHGFLGLNTHYQWFTVTGGSQTYMKKLLATLDAKNHRIISGDAVISVQRNSDNTATVKTGSNPSGEIFDVAILACHADEALALLENPTALESELLFPFHYQSNDTIVHTDTRVMPKRKRCWAAWNFRTDTNEASGQAMPSTHYWMNRLQGVSENVPYFVSLNARHLVDPEKILRSIDYMHPLFDLPAVTAQDRLFDLNRQSPAQLVYFCGSYFKYGFHEDALTSGWNLADHLLSSVDLSYE